MKLTDLIEAWRKQKKNVEFAKRTYEEAQLVLRSLADVLAEEMAAEGVQSIKHDDLLVYRTTMRSVTKASGVSQDEVLDCLQCSEFAFLIKPTYNAQSLKAAVLERQDANEPLPAGLDELLSIKEWPTVMERQV